MSGNHLSIVTTNVLTNQGSLTTLIFTEGIAMSSRSYYITVAMYVIYVLLGTQ